MQKQGVPWSQELADCAVDSGNAYMVNAVAAWKWTASATDRAVALCASSPRGLVVLRTLLQMDARSGTGAGTDSGGLITPKAAHVLRAIANYESYVEQASGTASFAMVASTALGIDGWACWHLSDNCCAAAHEEEVCLHPHALLCTSITYSHAHPPPPASPMLVLPPGGPGHALHLLPGLGEDQYQLCNQQCS
jgi:hypothetical protein